MFGLDSVRSLQARALLHCWPVEIRKGANQTNIEAFSASAKGFENAATFELNT